MIAIPELDRRAIAANLALHDFVRADRRRGHREWLHFFVAGDGIELFVNLSVVDDQRPSAPASDRRRALVLVRRGTTWLAAIDELATADTELHPGELACRFGDLHVAREGTAIRVHGHARDAAIELDVVLEPRSYPSLASDVRVGDAGAISWLVVPHLGAMGRVAIAGTTHVLDGAIAYHDHNWGVFDHGDFRWQWGHAQDEQGRAIVLSRLLDGVSSHVYLQSLFVWDGPRIARIFRGREIEIEPRGFLRRRTPVFPAIASTIAVGATEIPKTVAFRARGGSDDLTGEIVLTDASCLALADGPRLDTVLLYETLGRLTARGTIADRPFALDGTAVYETMRSA